MTHNFSILATAATVAFLAFSAGEASAMNLGNRGGQPGGPSGPTGSSSGLGNVYIHNGCDDHVDLSELVGGARRDYLRRCEQQNRGF
ncbi:MAG: hypothetical protein ABSF67_13210 [Roseiarcus sp.]|jgi:hypothetical protein